MSGYPEGLYPADYCHMEGHLYGKPYEKPVSTCTRCGVPNYPLRSWIGSVTRKANQWGCTWLEADERLKRETEEAFEREELDA